MDYARLTALLLLSPTLAGQISGWGQTTNRHYYSLPFTTWKQAKAYADAQPPKTTLVTIKDLNENDDLAWIFGSHQRIWIGLNDEATEGNWEWHSKDLSTYRNWAKGSPSSKNAATKDYAYIDFRTELWHDSAGVGDAGWAVFNSPSGSYETYGGGCASTTPYPTVRRRPSSPPARGYVFRFVAGGFQANAIGMLVFGHAGVRLPMTAFGAPNCMLLTQWDLQVPVSTDRIGDAYVSVAIPWFFPQTPPIHGQFFCVDRKSNRLGIATSDAFKINVGW